jgi:membrane dipeptidase
MKKHEINRRQLGALGAALAAGLALPARSQAPAPVRKPYIADMHSHYGMFLPRLFGMDLDKHMRENGIVLLSWAVVDDRRWISSTAAGLRQVAEPQPGQIWAYFQELMADYEGRLAQWKVAKALTAGDVDLALAGEPRVLLATEGANFVEGRVERVALAHAWGVRHMQLVHFIQSPLGDHQTANPRHGGLTSLGAQVVRECRRLGMVVDLAHGTAAMVDGVLDAGEGVPVWSHSWITEHGGGWQQPGYVARSLSLASARKIAARGGAVGLWTVRVNGDPAYPLRNVASYADEIMRMSELIGPSHVAFGTDMEGAGPGPILSTYAHLREVADNLVRRGLDEASLHAIFIGNYTRIVKLAMQGAARS